MDWIDEFGAEFKAASNLSDINKKRLINGVVKDILVNYDQEKKLHHLRINFRLPVLSKMGEILRANNVVLKRGNSMPKPPQTTEKTGAPNCPLSELLHGGEMFSMVGTYQPDKTITKNKFFLTLSVDYYSATLWYSPYNDYQQFLFDTISKMHDEGNSFIKIAKWLNQNHYLTPRGSDFKPNHAWSIYTKKNRSIQRFSRVYEPNISDLSIDVVDYMPMLDIPRIVDHLFRSKLSLYS